MKKLFYIIYSLMLLIACIAQKPEKQEIRFINEAVARVKNTNKLLILEFTEPQDRLCIRLRHDVFDNEMNRQFLNDNFELISVLPSDPVYVSLKNHFKLEYPGTVLFLDQNGNEIDRAVSYDGNKEGYLSYLKDVSVGKNLYSIVVSAYKRDSLNVRNNYIFAGKLMYRNQISDAIKQYSNVLLYDKDNKFGFNKECQLKISTSRMLMSGDKNADTYGSE